MATRKKASQAGKIQAKGTKAKKNTGNGRAAARPATKAKKAMKKPSTETPRRKRYLPPGKEERGLERAREEAGRQNLHWERNRQVVLSAVSPGKPN